MHWKVAIDIQWFIPRLLSIYQVVFVGIYKIQNHSSMTRTIVIDYQWNCDRNFRIFFIKQTIVPNFSLTSMNWMSSLWHYYIDLAVIYLSVIVSICPCYSQISRHLARILFVKIQFVSQISRPAAVDINRMQNSPLWHDDYIPCKHLSCQQHSLTPATR